MNQYDVTIIGAGAGAAGRSAALVLSRARRMDSRAQVITAAEAGSAAAGS
jgi:hypothetical protein